MAGIALAVAVGMMLEALNLLAVQDPPSGGAIGDPQIFLAVAPPRPGGIDGLSRFDVDVGVNVHGCKNPVRVTLGLALEGKRALPPASYVNARGMLFGELVDPTHTAAHFVEGELGRATWQSAFLGRLASKYINRPTVAVTRPRGILASDAPFVVARSWSHGSKQFGAPLDTWFANSSLAPGGLSVFSLDVMRLSFDVNWVAPRSYGTCYVRVPNLTTFPAMKGFLTPGKGQVSIDLNSGATIDASSSAPAPSNPRGPTWTCRLGVGPPVEGGGCAASAVLDLPNSGRNVQFYLLVVGTVIGLAFAVLAEALLSWNWPLPASEQPKDRQGLHDADRRETTRADEPGEDDPPERNRDPAQ